ncbi:MAG TPA: hypothetical protein VKZ96_19130 [Thermomicrobiales bacterium]|nr:hypothetical protein [Thermomicrobiales bacterium]
MGRTSEEVNLQTRLAVIRARVTGRAQRSRTGPPELLDLSFLFIFTSLGRILVTALGSVGDVIFGIVVQLSVK